MVIKVPNTYGRIDKLSENTNKKINNMKKNQSEIKTIMTKIQYRDSTADNMTELATWKTK